MKKWTKNNPAKKPVGEIEDGGRVVGQEPLADLLKHLGGGWHGLEHLQEGDQLQVGLSQRSNVTVQMSQFKCHSSDVTVQFNYLFHFTQSNAMFTVFQIIYVINKLYIQSVCIQLYYS